jgi:uncharacterized OsmC-like protein
MADELLTTRVRSVTSGEPGRSLNQARDHHFVIDGSPQAGGPGEEITPGESFLAGISACGVLLVEREAELRGVALRRAEAWIEGARRRDDPSWFVRIDLRFRLTGATDSEAAGLVASYQAA